METILCPTDFSQSSENAIRYADELAQHMNSRIVLFHNIYEPVGTEAISFGNLPNTKPFRDPRIQQAEQNKLEALKKALEYTDWGMPVQYETKIKYGLTKDTIPQMAREVQADMIVLGNDQAEGLKEVFMGSVAADVLKNTSCPVLIIPPKATFKPLRKIVFATDLQGEPFTDVSFVTKIAALFQAEIVFLHILTDDLPVTKQLAQTEFDRFHRLLPYKNVTLYIESNSHIEEGISQFCRKHHADMLVMGYHPRTFWHHLFNQDYTQELAFHTYLPLLVIHYRH